MAQITYFARRRYQLQFVPKLVNVVQMIAVVRYLAPYEGIHMLQDLFKAQDVVSVIVARGKQMHHLLFCNLPINKS